MKRKPNVYKSINDFDSYAEWREYYESKREHENKVSKRYAVAAIVISALSILLSILKFAMRYL